jgi:hypothetical protein
MESVIHMEMYRSNIILHGNVHMESLIHMEMYIYLIHYDSERTNPIASNISTDMQFVVTSEIMNVSRHM